jgi:hypothetical protein
MARSKPPLAFAVTRYAPQQIRDRDTGEHRWVPGWVPEHMTLWPDALLSMLTTFHEVEDKLRAPSWSPVFLDGDRRRNGAVRWVSCAVLDVDDGAPLREVSARFDGLVRICHTSWSHSEEKPKGRVVLPLAAPVPAEWWPRAWAEVQRRAGFVVDVACKDPSRLYFLPACKPGERDRHDAWLDVGTKNLLDLRPFEDLPETQQEQDEREARARLDAAKREGRVSTNRSRVEAYAGAVLLRAVAEVGSAGQGQRNTTLTRVAFMVGGYVGSGALSEEPTADALVQAGIASGLGARRASDIVRRQMQAGMARPIEVMLEDRPCP